MLQGVRVAIIRRHSNRIRRRLRLNSSGRGTIATVRYYSWLKRGLGATAAQVADQEGVPRSAANSLQVSLRLRDWPSDISQSFSLVAPGDVQAISTGAVLRCSPAAGSTDFAPGTFAYVEFADPDFPWLYTPARAGADGLLLPWLALVVVQEGEDIRLEHRGSSNPRLVIARDAGRLLPPIADLHAWAHVEEAEPTGSSAARLGNEPSAFVARILSPSRLLAVRDYLACLVPVFEAGRLAGLGRTSVAEALLAWSEQSDALDLPAYHYWRFRTGSRDFESLSRELKGYRTDGSVGLHDLDLAYSGGGLNQAQLFPSGARPEDALVSYAGALTGPDPKPRIWRPVHRQTYQAALAAKLPASVGTPAQVPPRRRYDAQRDDPELGAQLYGTWQASPAAAEQVQASLGAPVPTLPRSWVGEINGKPQLRAAAGLGARVVTRNQEEFAAIAWAQLAGAREVGNALRYSRLAMSAGKSLHGRIERLDTDRLVQITSGMHDLVPLDARKGASFAATTTASAAGDTFTAEFRRLALGMPSASRARGGARKAASSAMVEATRFAMSGAQAQLRGMVLPANANVRSLDDGNAATIARAPSAGGQSARTARSIGAPRGTTHGPTSKDIDPRAAKAPLVRATNPAEAVPKLVSGRIAGLPDGALKEDVIPRSIPISVQFDEATYRKLQAIDAEWLLPGFHALPDNSVSLVQANPQMVEAFLVGMNHEMAREFAWRQFPIALDDSWFRRFWNHADPDGQDIDPIAGWPVERRLGDGAIGGQAVVMIRSDLFRLYPATRVVAVPARWGSPAEADGEALNRNAQRTPPIQVRLPRLDAPQDWVFPEFDGRVGQTARFFGFPLSLAELAGEGHAPGWFVMFEQHVRDACFGLDEASNFPARPPALADDLHWGHFASSQEALDAMAWASAHPAWQARAIEGARWGRSSAETARLCRQKPVRVLIPAAALLATNDGEG